LGVNPRLGTRGEIGVGGDSTTCGDGIHPARVALADSATIGDGNHPDLGLPLPLPSEAPSHFAAIDDFVSFFLPSQPKTFAQVVRASPSPLMDRGGGRRDGFGAGRAGRGVGRTNARTNVWQKIDARNQQRNNQDLDPRQETRSGHGNSGFEEEDGERRERGFGDSRGN